MRFGTKGMMGVDYEERIDFNRLRRERVAKIKSAMKKTDLGCLLLFDTGNKRYATSTAVASPEVDNMARYAVVPRNGEPYIFGFGSEVAAEKLNCPWIADRAFPAHTTMFGALPRGWKAQIHHLTCGGGFFGTYNMCTGSSPRQSGVIDRPPVDDCVGVGGVVKPIWVVLRLRSKTPQGEMAWLGLGDLAESPSSDD